MRTARVSAESSGTRLPRGRACEHKERHGGRRKRELTHMQVCTELGVGRGAEVCVCERARAVLAGGAMLRIPSYYYKRMQMASFSVCRGRAPRSTKGMYSERKMISRDPCTPPLKMMTNMMTRRS